MRASARSRETLQTERGWETGAGRIPPYPPTATAPTTLAHRVSLKLLKTPGSSPGVRCGKQVLFTLQRRPWSQGMVPAEGSGLLGKWPVGTPGVESLAGVLTIIPPSGQSTHSQLFIGYWVCAPWRLLTGALVARVTLASPLTQSTWTLGGLHSCCSSGGWEWRTATRMKNRKRGQNNSTRNWIWGRRNKRGGGEQCEAPGPLHPGPNARELPAVSYDTENSSKAAASTASRRPW